jgi:hypothetical protein
MTADIIQFGDFALRRKRENVYFRKSDECGHIHLTLNDSGEIITCDDCSHQVSAYWAVRTIMEQWARQERKVAQARQQVQLDAAAIIHLKAAKLVERIWRSKNLVPCCPHCNKGIMPHDGLGSITVSKDIEIARRRKELR